ncbi:MAG: SMC-Scp complex subunit ScpB, partial [candidate division Zixibacteria bacterium]|nr:SMC-Scp complex subunit ScpB [candidate division Zixibacteria bacterium]
IRKIAGGYQLFIIEDYAGYIEELYTRRRNARLTHSALETMAIIAYRQPVTKQDIEMIRGVASDSVLHTLLEKKLITLSGRAQTIGRPLLYSTTDEFLKYFNLNSLDDLPKMQEIEELLSSREPNTQQLLKLETKKDASESLASDDDIIDEAEKIADLENISSNNAEDFFRR